MLAIWSLGLKTDRATLDIWMSVGKCLLANVSVGNFVSVCCNLSLAGALLQSEGELDCDVFQFRSALQSEQCSKAECQRVWRWQWSPSVTSPSLLPAWSLWRCSPIKSFMIISERTVWSLSEWKQWRLNFTWSKCTNSNYRREFNILSGTCTNVGTQLPRQKRQLFWSGFETTEWTYERAGYWLLAARRDNQGGKCFWWWCRYICEATVQLNLADEDSFREREGKPRKRIWWPTFNQDGNILTLACADDDEVATTCENHTHVLIWRRTWKLSKSFQKQQKWKYLCHLWNRTS